MKQKLLILHGALGAGSQLDSVAEHFTPFYDCFTFEFTGHGKRSGDDADFSISSFSKDLLNFIQAKEIKGCSVLGYSMGGYVALFTEAVAPGTFTHIITFATKFGWNPESAIKEASYLDPDKIETKVPDYAASLKMLHGDNWKGVLRDTASMMTALGNRPDLDDQLLGSLNTKVMLCLGDSDKMVSLQETISVKSKIQRASLFVMPRTAHPLEKIRLVEALPLFRSFLAS